MREARELFRFCFVNGRLDEGRVLKVVQSVIEFRRRGYLMLLGYFRRLVKLDCEQHTAGSKSAEPVPNDLRNHVQTDLERAYGPGLAMWFVLNPDLIGGMRVQVGSDVYDGSVQAGIARIEEEIRHRQLQRDAFKFDRRVSAQRQPG